MRERAQKLELDALQTETATGGNEGHHGVLSFRVLGRLSRSRFTSYALH